MKSSLHHLKKPFCVDHKLQLRDEISFSHLVTDKPQHQDQFYHISYDSASYGVSTSNEEMFSYYGAKLSSNSQTFGGYLPLINEFISSTILYTISNSREEQLFAAPRVLMMVEGEEFRLFSKMLQSFEKVKSSSIRSEIDCNASACYLAGLMIAMQEVDPNMANYGTLMNEDGERTIFAKIDSNTLFQSDPRLRRQDNGGIYFNQMDSSFSEIANPTERNRASFGTLVARNAIFESMSDPDKVRFVGDDAHKGCLKIKKGCDENFRYFMKAINDFIEMPNEFINFIKGKTYQDLRAKSPDLADQEKENIARSCRQFRDLKTAIGQYFENELALFAEKFPEDVIESPTIWQGVIRAITPKTTAITREAEALKKQEATLSASADI